MRDFEFSSSLEGSIIFLSIHLQKEFQTEKEWLKLKGVLHAPWNLGYNSRLECTITEQMIF